MFYGERVGTCSDPFGYAWVVAKTIEDVTMEQSQQHRDALTNKRS